MTVDLCLSVLYIGTLGEGHYDALAVIDGTIYMRDDKRFHG